MSLTSDQITAQNFKDFYEQIRPYLNGQVPTFANQFSRSDLYSTDEKIIGQWIDGKPLYQKTFSGTVSSANNISYVSIGASVDTVVDGRGILNNSVPLIGVTNESVSAGVSIFVNTNSAASNKNTFGVYSKPESQSAWVGSPYYFTLCYTKTTDSAIKVGTGTDYSTDEQIIGTWIDGKPIYQRVFVQSGTISTRTRYFESAFLAANIDNIVERTTNVAISYDGGSSIRGIYWVSNSDYFQCLVEKNGAYPVFSGSGITFSDLTVIVSYTKTTD